MRLFIDTDSGRLHVDVDFFSSLPEIKKAIQSCHGITVSHQVLSSDGFTIATELYLICLELGDGSVLRLDVAEVDNGENPAQQRELGVPLQLPNGDSVATERFDRVKELKIYLQENVFWVSNLNQIGVFDDFGSEIGSEENLVEATRVFFMPSLTTPRELSTPEGGQIIVALEIGGRFLKVLLRRDQSPSQIRAQLVYLELTQKQYVLIHNGVILLDGPSLEFQNVHNGDTIKIDILGIEATFTYEELQAATGDFNVVNNLGGGELDPVYRGTLEDGRAVAVKVLPVPIEKNLFVSEMEALSFLQNRNLPRLYGCCIEGAKRFIVYEFFEHTTLDQALLGKGSCSCLDWPTRLDICIGIGKCLSYLHEESQIVYSEVKASNIWLDSQHNPNVTIGYTEYAMRGYLTEKADVFGFGIVALEIVSGRPNSDPSQDDYKVELLEWAWHCHENKRDLELVDKKLSEFNKEEARRIIGVALQCCQSSPAGRPTLSRAVAMLSGDAEIPVVTSNNGYMTMELQ